MRGRLYAKSARLRLGVDCEADNFVDVAVIDVVVIDVVDIDILADVNFEEVILVAVILVDTFDTLTLSVFFTWLIDLGANGTRFLSWRGRDTGVRGMATSSSLLDRNRSRR